MRPPEGKKKKKEALRKKKNTQVKERDTP